MGILKFGIRKNYLEVEIKASQLHLRWLHFSLSRDPTLHKIIITYTSIKLQIEHI